MNKTNPLFFALILILGYLTAIFILAYLDSQTVFEPPFLLTTLNTIFTGLIPLVIAWIAARTYLKSGKFSVFWFGGGMLIFGLGSIAAGWLVLLPNSSNIIVTTHNTCVFISSLFYMIGVLFNLFAPSAVEKEFKRKVSRLLLFYISILIGTALYAIAAIYHLTPPFFIQGSGSTLIRSIILLYSIACFVFSASVFLNMYVKSKTFFPYWYFIAMSMLAIGLIAIYLLKSVGTPLSWLGRSAQYLGSVAALAAMVSVLRSSRKMGETVEETLTNFFSEAETSYKNLVTMASEAIISFNQHERIVLWNKAAEKMFGYSAREAIGLSFFETVLLEPYGSLRKTIAQMTLLEGIFSKGMDEWEARRKDGSHFPVEYTYSPQKMQPGWMVTFILRDITKRKQKEAALQHETVLRNDLLENLPCIAMTIKKETREIVFSNEFARRAGALPGKTCHETIMNQNMPCSFCRAPEMWYSNSPSYLEVEHEGKCFDVRWLPLSDELYIHYIFDITERKQAEAELQRETMLRNLLLENLPCIAMILKKDTREIVVSNQAARNAGAVPGKTCYETCANRSTPCPFCLAPEIWATNSPRHIEVEYEGKYYEDHWFPLSDELYVHYIFDISERKRAEQIMLETQKMVSMGELTAGVAHEINSPLQVITGLSERILRQLERGQLDENQLPQDVATINRIGWNIAKIIRSLLTYAQETKGLATPQDLDEIIKDTLLLTEHKLRTWANIQISTDIEESMPALHCERNQIVQVLINLLVNARDAMPEGGNIMLRAHYEPEQQRFGIQVSDTGCGMTPEIKKRLFDPFFTTKPVGEGTGLGLPVVLGIIKTHGGDIKVESYPKKGTTFTIHLPRNPVMTMAAEPDVLESGRYSSR